MSGPLIVGAEGVILVPSEKDFGSSRPIEDGIQLVDMLRKFPTTRTVVQVGVENTEHAEYWVRVNGLPGTTVVGIPPADRKLEPATAQWAAIKRQRAQGPVNLVLTAWHSVYVHCTQTHQPVLLFGRRGAVGSTDIRPTWDELHDSVVLSRDAAVEDPDNESAYYE